MISFIFSSSFSPAQLHRSPALFIFHSHFGIHRSLLIFIFYFRVLFFFTFIHTLIYLLWLRAVHTYIGIRLDNDGYDYDAWIHAIFLLSSFLSKGFGTSSSFWYLWISISMSILHLFIHTRFTKNTELDR